MKSRVQIDAVISSLWPLKDGESKIAERFSNVNNFHNAGRMQPHSLSLLLSQ